MHLLVLVASMWWTAPAAAGPGIAHPLRFVREHIEIELDGTSILVDGDYTFRSITDQPARALLLYPFPLGPGMRPPTQIEVDGAAYAVGARGLVLEMAGDVPGGESVVHIHYRQRVAGTRAQYILTTTRSWDRPLEQADIRIRFPAAWRTLRVSYPGDEIEAAHGLRQYVIRQTGFWPDHDLQLRWTSRDRGVARSQRGSR